MVVLSLCFYLSLSFAFYHSFGNCFWLCFEGHSDFRNEKVAAE